MIDYEKDIKNLNLNLDSNQINKLVSYCKLVEKYNKDLKLVSCELKDFVNIHLYDILQITKKVNLEGKTCVDVGSGNGLPSIALSIYYPNIDFYLVERMKRRVDFLLLVKTLCNLKNVSIIEKNDLEVNQKFDIYTARAFANGKDLANSINHLLKDNGIAYLYKGQRLNCEKEVDIFKNENLDSQIINLDDISNSQRNLIVVRKGDRY